MNALRKVFFEELAEAYDVEKELLKALPKMAAAAASPELKQAFELHLEETQGHLERLEEVFARFGHEPKGRPSQIMRAIIREGQARIRQKAGDAALIGAAQKVEYYEIALYTSLYSSARFLNQSLAAELLHQILTEERLTADMLTGMGKEMITATVFAQAA